MPVTPRMTSGGNLTVDTATPGTNWATFPSQLCKQLCIVNNSGQTIEFRQDGAGAEIAIPTATTFPIYGLNNASQIGVKRVDDGAAVAVTARWEA